jgi:hypothetical protein
MYTKLNSIFENISLLATFKITADPEDKEITLKIQTEPM